MSERPPGFENVGNLDCDLTDDQECGARPASLAEVRAERRKAEMVAAARRRQFAAHADQAIGVVTSVGETDQGLTAEVNLVTRSTLFESERNTVQFLADPRFGFQLYRPDFFADPEARRTWVDLPSAPTLSRRVRLRRWLRAWVKRARLSLAGRIGGQDLHEDCY